MITADKDELKAKRNCLLVLRNKKINIFDGAENIVKGFAVGGYYFDKINYVAFDKPDEIVRSLIDGKENYENFIIFCPAEMEETLKKFVTALYKSEFNELGILKSGKSNAFILFSDRENRLRSEDINNILDKKYGLKHERAYVKTIGAPAQAIGKAIEDAIKVNSEKTETVKKLVDFNVSENFGECTIEVIYSDEIPKSIFDNVFRTLVNSLDEYVYSVENFKLAERLVQLLKLRRMKISVAESFTGGGVGKKLVEIPGASEVYREGLNTYSNEAKIGRLGVGEDTLRRCGAVSEETAAQMAEGLINSGNCDISIATTGIAGPKSDNTNKPVGLIFIAIGLKERVEVYKYNLKGTREQITETAINLALFLAYKTLK